MYRTKEQVGWDNKNTANFAGGKKEGLEEGRKEERLKALAEKKVIAKNLKIKGISLEIIAGATDLSIEEIVGL